MQRHEGPGRDHDAEERQRQRALSRWLLIAIVVLAVLLAVLLFDRWW